MRVRANIPARGRQSVFWTSVWLALALAAVLAGCGAQVGDWQSISTDSGGPIFGIGAQPAPVISLAADPRIAGLVYIGTDSAGVRRTTADTTGVEAASAGMAQGSSVFALTPDPSASGTVYAGTSTGFYRSTDASASWQARDTGLPEKEAITSVAAGPNGAPLLAGTMSHGLFLSADQGASWQPATGLPADGRVSAALWIEGAKTALVAFAGGHLYVARDDLRQWTQSDAGLPANSDIQALAASADGRTVYAGSSQGLFSSGDSGRTWASVGGDLPTGSVGALATDTRQSDALYAAVATSVYTTTDGGKTWRIVSGALDKPARALAVATNRAQTPVTYATTGQLYRYPAAGGGGSFAPAIILVIAVVVIAALFIRSRRATRRERSEPASPEPKTPPVTDTRSPAERYGDADEM